MKVNEIFYSLQGEGYHAGTAAVFIRLSGCNLKCPFCDTDFSASEEMSVEEIVDEVCRYSTKCHLAVITGGEPTLQDCVPLIDALQKNGYSVAMESNGTRKAPYNRNWLTISPKSQFIDGKAAEIQQTSCNELKVVFDGENDPSVFIDKIAAAHYYLQPCDTGNAQKNEEIMQKCVEYIKQNPLWKMSLQTQKILKVR